MANAINGGGKCFIHDLEMYRVRLDFPFSIQTLVLVWNCNWISLIWILVLLRYEYRV